MKGKLAKGSQKTFEEAVSYNRKHPFVMPRDHKAIYEQINIRTGFGVYPCLKISQPDSCRDRADEIDLIVNASKGTKYEDVKGLIKRRNTENITQAVSAGDPKVQALPEIITEVLMDGYIDSLFRLVLSGKDRETTCKCLEAIAYVYETGMISLMKKEK